MTISSCTNFVEGKKKPAFLRLWFVLSSSFKKRATQVFLGFPTQQHFDGLVQEVMPKAILAAHQSFS
jgi:hypothetical protein